MAVPFQFRAVVVEGKVRCVECGAEAPGLNASAVEHPESCPTWDPGFYGKPQEEESYEGKKAMASRRKKVA